ncbi:MAG: restriction endonuclease subunit R, partial [Prevotella sp.]|nr:restriction endonuclease subunit R [Prevotella sp.]
ERQDMDVLGDGVFDVNILTVIASESYEHFSKLLQTELAEDVADRPVEVTAHLFEDILLTSADGEEIKTNINLARKIYFQLIKNDYVDDNGKLTEKYFNDKKSDKINLGTELEPIKAGIVSRLETIYNPDKILYENARKPKVATFQEDKFKGKFMELWNRINVKSYYKVEFDSKDLIKSAITNIDKNLKVTEIRIVVEHGGLENIRDREALQAGVAMSHGQSRTIKVTEAIGSSVRYDLIGDLVNATGLTRKTIVEILKGIKPASFAQFKMNPEEFVIKTANIINDVKALSVIQQISYVPSSNKYDMDIFTESTLRGKLGVNAIESHKSLYDIVVVDSMGIEKNFAEALEREEAVEVYTKLPRGFYINTPMGHYNPDWAVVFREGAVKHVYFVAETKGNDLIEAQLRGAEAAKIECARKHFAAISSSDVKYGVVKDYQSLYDLIAK